MENKSNRVYFILRMNRKMSLAYSKRRRGMQSLIHITANKEGDSEIEIEYTGSF